MQRILSMLGLVMSIFGFAATAFLLYDSTFGKEPIMYSLAFAVLGLLLFLLSIRLPNIQAYIAKRKKEQTPNADVNQQSEIDKTDSKFKKKVMYGVVATLILLSLVGFQQRDTIVSYFNGSKDTTEETQCDESPPTYVFKHYLTEHAVELGLRDSNTGRYYKYEITNVKYRGISSDYRGKCAYELTIDIMNKIGTRAVKTIYPKVFLN